MAQITEQLKTDNRLTWDKTKFVEYGTIEFHVKFLGLKTQESYFGELLLVARFKPIVKIMQGKKLSSEIIGIPLNHGNLIKDDIIHFKMDDILDLKGYFYANLVKPMQKLHFDVLEIKKSSIQVKIELQEEYCISHNRPNFVPSMGICDSCGKQIFDSISEENAKSEKITGCPHCHFSFCE